MTAEDLRPFLTLRETAARLGWSVRTIGRHVVPVADWDEGSGQIPVVKIGGRAHVPRWWIDSVLSRPPAPE